ncbi:MAG TPA: HAMP domain-containing sensor histidine kinase, partial [Puia sp.]|nr:HAMP domain-containing sensor histidine kinase [Puia sp.]
IIRYVLIRQLDNTLKVEEAEIMDFVRNHDSLPQATHYKDQHTSFEAAGEPVRRKFHNIVVYDPRDGDEDAYRELIFPVSVKKHFYTASVTKSEGATEFLVWLIVLITVLVIGLLLLILFGANRLMFRKTWKSFYDTLGAIRRFNLSSKQYTGPGPSNIDEFNDLDAAIRLMTSKIVQDYESLKAFADNASHEMHTPLAIINSKLDLLIQGHNLDEEQVKQLQAIYDGVRRLTKLNQSLLLLSKIENNQFPDVKPVPLQPLIEEKLFQFEDIIRSKQIEVHTDMQPARMPINEYLAEILLNNLLNNAIRHNQPNGVISVLLRPGMLEISNSGAPLDFDSREIFERFRKGDHSEGSGLGLAIVKQICDTYHFQIGYDVHGGLHRFSVGF